ncbi:helix-turn-helix domain-containing protein [Methylobacterium sp. WSM2598]|uniref:helix-turn-helix domain-containing protein n=1 Tax=Methylobacterium sp. WSM2598 TaxID=398261 RepID=UPI000382F209|nr:helix-turn-helix domain-containing protein [Methylobacterium sp. WSM2598]
MNADIEKILAAPTVDAKTAGALLGMGESATYKALQRGDIPAIKIGSVYRVPSATLRRMLDLAPPKAA